MNEIAPKNKFLIGWCRIRYALLKLISEPVFYIFIISMIIYLPWLLPNLSDIAPWDETYYIIEGKQILSGELPKLAGGPLLNIFYLLCYLPFMGSPFWLIHANTLGRFLLFSFIFVGTWHVGKALKNHFNPIILFGFLFLAPILTQNFEYPADLLFAALSALAFSQAVNFLKTKKIKYIWWSSFWLGMGMLTRGDAMILMVALTLFVLWVGLKQQQWWRLVLAALFPFLALSVGYFLLSGIINQNFDSGMAERSYMAFEQGQEVDMPDIGGRFNAPTESYYVARELFGTPAENDLSVLRAIRRNPQAYLSRLWQVIKSLPGLFLTAYYRRYTIFIVLLAFRGVIELIRRKKWRLLVLHAVWVLPLIAGIARTLVRVGYFRLFFFVMFSLAVIGLKTLLESLNKNKEGLVWAGLMAAVMVLAFIVDDMPIRFGMMVFLCWLLLAFLLSKRSGKYPHWQEMAMLLLLAGGILLTGTFVPYQTRILGQDPQEKASLALREVTDPEDIVLTCTPSVVFLAEREVANFCGADIPVFESSVEFIDWMAAQNFDAIYLDRETPAILWEMSVEQRGKALTQVYGSEGNREAIMVLVDDR